MAGSRLLITDAVTGRTTDVCGLGSCWRPAWSPDGQTLAFYSDAGGPPALWVYELATQRARQHSTDPVKAKLWAGDEPRWSPDGKTLFVPLAPGEGPYRSPVRPAAGRKDSVAKPDDPRVTVILSGAEAKAAPPQEVPVAEPIVAHMRRENLASVAAVDLRTGTRRGR